MITISV